MKVSNISETSNLGQFSLKQFRKSNRSLLIGKDYVSKKQTLLSLNNLGEIYHNSELSDADKQIQLDDAFSREISSALLSSDSASLFLEGLYHSDDRHDLLSKGLYTFLDDKLKLAVSAGNAPSNQSQCNYFDSSVYQFMTETLNNAKEVDIDPNLQLLVEAVNIKKKFTHELDIELGNKLPSDEPDFITNEEIKALSAFHLEHYSVGPNETQLDLYMINRDSMMEKTETGRFLNGQVKQDIFDTVLKYKKDIVQNESDHDESDLSSTIFRNFWESSDYVVDSFTMNMVKERIGKEIEFVQTLEQIKSLADQKEESLSLMVSGHKRHGKDTACEFLNEKYGFTYAASSEYANDKFLFDKLAPIFGYKTKQECFEDRYNHRDLWFDEITEFNQPLHRMGSMIYSEFDGYCGIRNADELNALKEQGLIDLSLWVDASERKPPEDQNSMTATQDMFQFTIDNNGTEANFEQRLSMVYEVLPNYTLDKAKQKDRELEAESLSY